MVDGRDSGWAWVRGIMWRNMGGGRYGGYQDGNYMGNMMGIISEKLEVMWTPNSLAKDPRGLLRDGERFQRQVWVDVADGGALVQGKWLCPP